MLVLGVTGNIGSGKSTVCRILETQYDIPFIYVDKISRYLVKPGMPLLAEVEKQFGKKAILDNGEMNRAYLRNLIITCKESKKILDEMFEPYMINEVKKRIIEHSEFGEHIVGVENALIFEREHQEFYSRILLVGCSEEIQLKRVMERDGQSKEAALGIMKLQIPFEKKRKMADFVIENESTLEVLKKNIDHFYNELINEQV